MPTTIMNDAAAPKKNVLISALPKGQRYTKRELAQDLKTMEIDVANPLRMLSAYFITSATKSPPSALARTTYHVKLADV
jgi:hypothetical protein